MANYEKYLTNEVTGEEVLIKSNDYTTFQSKIRKKQELWGRQNHKLLSVEEAQNKTEAARRELEAFRSILSATLVIDDKIDWESLKSTEPFPKYEPELEPYRGNFYNNVPAKGLFDFLPFVSKRRISAEEAAARAFAEASTKYQEEEARRVKEYEEEKVKFQTIQAEENARIEEKKNRYEGGVQEGVQDYISLVLERSSYPDSLSLFPDVKYDVNSKTLLIDMDLPDIEHFPRVLEYKYVVSKKEVVEKTMKIKEFDIFYNDTLFQIALRTIHEVCESDYAKHIDLVVFNGWVEGIDPKTGASFRNCTLSIQVDREEFETLKLDRIDPKECFKHLKGVSAGNLVNMAPVKPIMVMNRDDKRIVEARSVIGDIDDTVNLAKMDWQEFEVLVRDLIKHEFAREGCDVSVTRASRDAGVDAIAFDEDPIRGGKFVIQAKRYNNLVPVSAVRDLYGTVMNEGAVKGILITTSYYGKDSMEFVKDKPLTLINGEELIYMFNKHGYSVKIELEKKQRALSSANY